MSIPLKDTLLVAWGGNFDQKATASAATYGLSAAQATSFHTAYQSFLTAFNAVAQAREAGARSKLLTTTKDTAKANLLHVGRELYGFIQDSTTVTIANKEDIGVNPRTNLPSPLPVPQDPPVLKILKRMGTQVTIRLSDTVGGRSKPAAVQGARVYSYIGATTPVDLAAWKFEGMSTRSDIEIEFPNDTAPGAMVWFTAQWYNPRGETGPGCAPVCTNIAGGAMPMAA